NESLLRAENGRFFSLLQKQSSWKCIFVANRNETKDNIHLCSPDQLLQTLDQLICNICYNISRSPVSKTLRPKVSLNFQPEEYTLNREELTVLLRDK
ncbi:MAG: hypothetical protein ABFD91_17070, partial [Anaerohalosphaeraceae bacterium]